MRFPPEAAEADRVDPPRQETSFEARAPSGPSRRPGALLFRCEFAPSIQFFEPGRPV
jgi:hypothetical protein